MHHQVLYSNMSACGADTQRASHIDDGLGSPLCEPFKPFERVIQEHPILLRGLTFIGKRGPRQINIREIIEIRCIVDPLHLHGYRCRTITDVVPVDAAEEEVRTDVLDAVVPAEPAVE